MEKDLKQQEDTQVTDEERAAIAAEVFGEEHQPVPAEQDATTTTDEPGHLAEEQSQQEIDDEPPLDEHNDEPPPPRDEWEGVPDIVKNTLQGIQQSLTGLQNGGNQEHRLKQLESRLGGVINELHNAKEAAKKTDNAPSKEEMAAAAKSDEKWSSLKDEYPEWGDILDVIGDRLPTTDKQPPPVDVDALRKEIREELETDFSKRLTTAQIGSEVKLVALMHPDYESVSKSPEFDAFLKAKGDAEYARVRGSNDSVVVCGALQEFKDSRSKDKAPPQDPPQGDQQQDEAANLLKQRSGRVKQSATKRSTSSSQKRTRPKAQEEMTEAELRASIADEVFSED